MSEYSKNLSLLIGSILIIFSLAFFIPISFVALESPENVSITQTEGEQTVISANIISTLTNVDTSGQGSINVTVLNEDTGNSDSTGELPQGSSIDISIGGNTITVTNENIINSNTALISYEYPLFIGWPNGAKTIVENMQFLIIFTAILFMIGVLILVMRGFKNAN